jgi:hypothetical protein
MWRVVMPATVRTTSMSSSRGWTRVLYPVRMHSMSAWLFYSSKLMDMQFWCSMAVIQQEFH